MVDKQRAIDILWAEIGNNQQPLCCTRKELCGAVEMAEDAIRRAQPDHIGDATAMVAQPGNAPLTLEDLRGMDGWPVWITGGGFWALVKVSGKVVYLTENSGEMVYADKWMKHMGDILRRKPEGGAK